MIIKEKHKKVLSQPKDAAGLLWNILKTESKIDRDKEHLWTIGLSGRNTIKYIELVSLGLLDANLVHPREVFRLAISKGIAQLIIGHNHPSGDCRPSEDDLTTTKRLVEAGKILDIKVIDHIIIGKRNYFSFADEGLIK